MTEDYKNRILDIRLCSSDSEFFFSDDIFEENVFMEYLVERYSACIPDSFKSADEGIMISKHQSEDFSDICRSLGINEDEIILCYKEKNRPNTLAVTANGMAIINNPNDYIENMEIDLLIEGNASKTGPDSICLSYQMIKFLKDMAVLKNHRHHTSGRHPANDRSYSECSAYIKIICLFCGCKGFTSAQMIRIAELSKTMEIPSGAFIKLLNMIQRMTIPEREAVLTMIISETSIDDPVILLCDILYMIWLGHYDVEREHDSIVSAAHILNQDVNIAFNIYNKIKEN